MVNSTRHNLNQFGENGHQQRKTPIFIPSPFKKFYQQLRKVPGSKLRTYTKIKNSKPVRVIPVFRVGTRRKPNDKQFVGDA